MCVGDAHLRLCLRSPVVGHGRERVVLDVRRALAPVEDDVRGEMHEPRAHSRCSTSDGLGPHDRDLAGIRPVLQVRGVDDYLGANTSQKLIDGDGVTDFDPLGRRGRNAPDELGAEVAGRAGDVHAHALARRLRKCRTTSTIAVTPRATTNARISPFQGSSSNDLPPM